MTALNAFRKNSKAIEDKLKNVVEIFWHKPSYTRGVWILTLPAEHSADSASPLLGSPHRALQLLAQEGPLQLPAQQSKSAQICKWLKYPNWHYKEGNERLDHSFTLLYSITDSYCTLRMILVVSCIKRLQIIRIISDKDWNVATVFHQVLLVFCLEVTAPL